MSRPIFVLHVIVALSIIFPTDNAYAYLDPGTGGLILQLLVVIFGTLLFYAKRIYKFINQKIFKMNKEKDSSDKKE